MFFYLSIVVLYTHNTLDGREGYRMALDKKAE